VIGFRCDRVGPDSPRRCPRCERWFPPSEFYGDKSKPSGPRSICEECDRAKARDYYKRAGREQKLR